jgi:hypothetical protein
MRANVSIIEGMPKWYPLTKYLGELRDITDLYRRHKNVMSADVQMQPGRLVVYWVFPNTERRAQVIREFMETIYNVNLSYIEILKRLSVTIYHQELSFTDFFLRVDLLVPHHFPELVKFRQSPVPWDLPNLIAALDKVAIDRKAPW